MNPIEEFLSIVSARIVWPSTPNTTARYEIWGAGWQGRVVVEIEAGWFGGTLVDAAVDLPFSAPLAAFVGENVEIFRTPGAWWVGLLPRGIRRGDTITLYFPRSGFRHQLFVADFSRLDDSDQQGPEHA